MFDLCGPSPLSAKRCSEYVHAEPSWDCTPRFDQEAGKTERNTENFDDLLDSIEAPRFLDFEEMIREQGGNRGEDFEFGRRGSFFCISFNFESWNSSLPSTYLAPFRAPG